jgi:hypothetical protein
MKATYPKILTLVAATAFAVGCGKGDVPEKPAVKQEIAPERALKKIDLVDQKKKALSGN